MATFEELLGIALVQRAGDEEYDVVDHVAITAASDCQQVTGEHAGKAYVMKSKNLDKGATALLRKKLN